ncbi:hypothetical protein N665_0383s0155 [Sinapis alba]|nr:hypothetical protein N665_0383s0155 [Sinapis alba]
MSSSSTNIHFDYETSSLEDITSSLLKERICRKMTTYPFTKKLNLSCIPLVMEPKRQSYILDDEYVFVYLTSDIKELNIVPIIAQLSRVEKESSYDENYSDENYSDENYSEIASGLPEFEGNPGALTLFTPIQEAKRHLKGFEGVDNVVNEEVDSVGTGLDNTYIMDNEDNIDNYVGSGAI